jgi:hypothetical protein
VRIQAGNCDLNDRSCIGSVNNPLDNLEWASSYGQEKYTGLSVEAHLDGPIFSHGSDIDARADQCCMSSSLTKDGPFSPFSSRNSYVSPLRPVAGSNINRKRRVYPTRQSEEDLSILPACFTDNEQSMLEGIDILFNAASSRSWTPALEKWNADRGLSRPDTQAASHLSVPPKDNCGIEETSAASSISYRMEDVHIDPGNLTMIGLNQEAEALWQYRLTRFLCCPEKFTSEVQGFGVLDGAIRASRSDLQSLRLAGREEPQAGRGDFPHRTRPFFSYVRTREGSSLLTEIRVLKRMFPDQEERSLLVYSGGDLDDIDVEGDALIPVQASPYLKMALEADRMDSPYFAAHDIRVGRNPGRTIQKCLRMDLGTLQDQDTVHLGNRKAMSECAASR